MLPCLVSQLGLNSSMASLGTLHHCFNGRTFGSSVMVYLPGMLSIFLGQQWCGHFFMNL